MVAFKEKQEFQTFSWLDIYLEYNESSKRIKNYKTFVTDKAENEIIGELVGEMQEIISKLKTKILYEHNPITEEDLEKFDLTPLQKEVLKYRLRHTSYATISNMLGSTPQAVYDAYKRGIHRLISQKKGEVKLSPQQQKILLLYKEGKKQKEIADGLDIKVNSVKTQLKKIKDKMQLNSITELL